MTNQNCVFCKIVNGKLPSIKVQEWDDAIAIVPLAPVTENRFENGKGHVLIIPKQHVADFAENAEVTALTCKRAAEFGKNRGGDINLITSKGKFATQTVLHLHVHIVPRIENDNLPLPWTPQQSKEVNE